MKAPLFGRIAILGAGLMGGSLASAASRQNIAMHIAAYDISADNLTYLQTHNLVHSVHDTVADAVRDADLVVLAVPPDALATLTASAAPHLKNGCILTDVTSIKRQAIASIKPHLPSHVNFVPAHPIAGAQKSGAAAANSELFAGKRIILTPTEDEVLSEAVAQVRSLWETVGGQVEYMPADLHDRVYAYVSHLPQIAAFAAMTSVSKDDKNPACAGVVRLAQSNVSLWADICLANADFIHEAMEEFSTFLSQMSFELTENAQESVVDNDADTIAPALLCAVVALCLVATTLILEQRTGANPGSFGGSGFKDMTAAAGKESDSVLGAISNHPEAVAELLNVTLGRLNSIGAALSLGSREALEKAFAA